MKKIVRMENFLCRKDFAMNKSIEYQEGQVEFEKRGIQKIMTI